MEKPVHMGAPDPTVTSDTANKDEALLGYTTSKRLKRFLRVQTVNYNVFVVSCFPFVLFRFMYI